MKKVSEVPVYVVWWSDGEEDFVPVAAAADEAEAYEYVYDREDDNNVYTVTTTQAIRPTLED